MATTDKEEKLSEHEEKILCQWNPPKIPVSNVYRRRGMFDIFWKDIKKVSKTVAIKGEYSDFQLLTKGEILGHILKKYDEIHIGMVQVAVKPLTLQGLNFSVFVCLRDARESSFGKSRLAVVETSLCDGPIYFVNSPNEWVSLKVSTTNILDTLTLNIRTTGLPKGGQGHLVVVYNVFYKVLIGPQLKWINSYKRGETVFVESNLLRHDKVPIEQVFNWSSLVYPNKWITNENTSGGGGGGSRGSGGE